MKCLHHFDRGGNNTLDTIKTVPLKLKDDYDDGNIPEADLPQDVIPDEVPRKDGPGGESGK